MHILQPSQMALFKLQKESANYSPGLPLVGLAVLEREPTRSLVRARLSANLAVATGKQDTPQRNQCEKP